MQRVDENISPVGKILKTHGVKGEVTMSVENDALYDAERIIVPVGGLFVPFYIDERRAKSDSVDIIKLDGIDSESDALPLLGADVYLKNDELEEGESVLPLIGYKLYNSETLVGEIAAIDDQTENVLFIIDGPDGEEILIPAVDEWVVSVDDNAKRVVMNLPEGLVDS